MGASPKPRAVTGSSIPGMLQSFQNEWDAVMLETFTLRKQLDTTRQELAKVRTDCNGSGWLWADSFRRRCINTMLHAVSLPALRVNEMKPDSEFIGIVVCILPLSLSFDPILGP